MEYLEQLKQVKEWAKDLLIIQYHESPKNKAFIELMVDLLFANMLIVQIRDLCLNVDKSIGAQLDVVGRWVGIDRYYNAIDLWERPYTALVNYTNVSSGQYKQYQGGFSTFLNFEDHIISINLVDDDFKNAVGQQEGRYIFIYTASGWQLNGDDVNIADYGITYPATNTEAINDTITVNYFDNNITYTLTSENQGGFLTYNLWRETRLKTNQMGDNYFRQLIKLKIIKNEIRYTNKNIDDAIWEWSSGRVYTTWSDMEVTYHYQPELYNLIQLAIYKGVLLAPTGCTIKTEVIQ